MSNTSLILETIYAEASPRAEQGWEKHQAWTERVRILESQLESLRRNRAREQESARQLEQQLHAAEAELARLYENRRHLAEELDSSAALIRSLNAQIARQRESNYRLQWLVGRLSSDMEQARMNQLNRLADEACHTHFKPVLNKYGLAYDGEVRHGMRHGHGCYAGDDYEYVGFWGENLPHGEGIRKTADGGSEKGEFAHGMLLRGMRILPEGIQEEGSFTQGMLSNGRRQWPDGRYEQGSFCNGLLADGRRQGLNGQFEEGSFAEGCLVQGTRQTDDYLEHGEFSRGMLHGDGKRSTAQGHLLCEGRFVRGLLHGKGMMQIWEWDMLMLRVTGTFCNGKANGEAMQVDYFNRDTGAIDITMRGTIIENMPKQVHLRTHTGTEFSGELAASGYHDLIRQQPMSLHINRFAPARGHGRCLHGNFEVRNGLIVFELSDRRTKAAALSQGYPDPDVLWFRIGQPRLNFENGISLELSNEAIDNCTLPGEFNVLLNGQRYGHIQPPSHFSSERRLEALAGLLNPALRRRLMPQRLKSARDLQKHDEVIFNREPWYLLRGITPAGHAFVLRLRKDLRECDLE